jgi:glycosyltransferase involved in cell wall biosynthesis
LTFYGLAKKYDTGNNRIFIRNFKPSYFSVADIYVSNSFSDGTSASLLEAMACSLAPVVTEISGNVEWIKDGVNGLLVSVEDSEGLTEDSFVSK